MRRAIVLMIIAGAGCFPRSSVPDTERQRASHELAGQRRFARVALYVGRFFGDASKRLVSDQPFQELDLLQTTEGNPIAPPRPDRVLVPGTPLRIERVEFPTGWLIAKRVVMTPRYHPWVYLALDRALGTSDPAPAYQALPDPERRAIAKKEVVEGMAPQTVEMAWGYPEKKVIDRPAGTEEWTWPAGRRKAS